MEKDEEIFNKIDSNAINVLSLIYARIYFPTYSNSLKEIGVYLGEKWSEENATGLQSLVWRHNWETTGKENLKNKLIQYNSEDCFVLKCVTEKIIIISNKNNERNSHLSSVEDMKEEDYKKWEELEYQIPDLDFVNKCAYFSYQGNGCIMRTSVPFFYNLVIF